MRWCFGVGFVFVGELWASTICMTASLRVASSLGREAAAMVIELLIDSMAARAFASSISAITAASALRFRRMSFCCS